jgi:hypothetical protein
MKASPKIFLSFLAAAFVLAAGAHAQTDQLLTNPSGTEGYNSPPPAVFGYSFTTGLSLQVYTMMGFYDVGNNGLAASHVVTLFTSGGTQLATATIPAGGGATADSFQWVDIAPVVLAPNTTYVLGASYAANDPDHLLLGTATLPPGTTLNNAQWENQTGGTDMNTFPDMVYSANQAFIGPNLAVPEASSWVAAGLAAAMLAVQILRAHSFSKHASAEKHHRA